MKIVQKDDTVSSMEDSQQLLDSEKGKLIPLQARCGLVEV